MSLLISFSILKGVVRKCKCEICNESLQLVDHKQVLHYNVPRSPLGGPQLSMINDIRVSSVSV